MDYDFNEKFNSAIRYIENNNKRLYDVLMKKVSGEDDRKEVWLEMALCIGIKKGFDKLAFDLIDMYEDETLETGESLPFLVWSTREFLVRSLYVTHETSSSNKRLYVFEMENKTVKIGIATDVERRKSQVQSSSGMIVKKYAYTDIFNTALEEEQRLHKRYKENRKKGEYFDIPYEVALKEIKKISDAQGINYLNGNQSQKKVAIN